MSISNTLRLLSALKLDIIYLTDIPFGDCVDKFITLINVLSITFVVNFAFVRVKKQKKKIKNKKKLKKFNNQIFYLIKRFIYK